MKGNRGITLIALVITIIVLLILAAVTIGALLGENGLITRALEARERTKIAEYKEKIELVRLDLKMKNEDFLPASVEQLSEEFNRMDQDKRVYNWVKSTSIITDVRDGIQKLDLRTKEGFIFYVTGDGVEYKGKGEVKDTTALYQADAVQLEKIEEKQTKVVIKISKREDVDKAFKLQYQFQKLGQEAQENEWKLIESGKTVEVPYGSVVYAKLLFGSDSGVIVKMEIESIDPTLVVKDTDTSDLERKTSIAFADLFDMVWGSEGTGTLEYTVTGNLKFDNSEVNSTEMDNIADLELGTYTITCKLTSPDGQELEATKENVNITSLATTIIRTYTGPNSAMRHQAKAIYSAYDLAYFRDLVNDGQNTLNAGIMDNLDLGKVCSSEMGSWEPIGTRSVQFKGIFDANGNGQGTQITNLYIDSSEPYQGLFGVTKEATIRNVTLENGSITGGYCVGGIAGYTEGGNVENCNNNHIAIKATDVLPWEYVWSETALTFGFSGAGGILGSSTNTNVSDCVNQARVEGTKCAIGGIIGWEEGTQERTIKNCTNKGNIVVEVGDKNDGGIAGIVGQSYNQAIIQTCSNEADITGTSGVAGIVGFMADGKILECHNSGHITGTSIRIGGIVGELSPINKNSLLSQILNCSNRGAIESSEEAVGGIGGYIGNAKIDNNCSNYASITGKAKVGGIAGEICKEKGYTGVELKNAYNEGTITNTGSTTIRAYHYNMWDTWESSVLGGIVGRNSGGKIEYCQNKGTLASESNYDDIGGIVGVSENGGNISYCANLVNIEDPDTRDIGGIAGANVQGTIEECYNIGDLTGTISNGGISGFVVASTIKNCYNTGTISGTGDIGGIVGIDESYKNELGSSYMYNCYNIGLIKGNSGEIDCWVGKSNYLTWDHLYTTKKIYDQVGDGTKNNESAGTGNAFQGPSTAIKSNMLTGLLNGNGANKWARDTEGNINDGYPYLVNNH